MLARELGAGWLQIDSVWLALQEAFPPGSAEHTLLAIDERIRQQSGTPPELVDHQIEASRFVCRALRRAFMFELEAHGAVVTDGAWLLPEFMTTVEIEDTRVAGAIIHEPARERVKAAMASRRKGARMVAPWHDLSATVSWQFGNRMAEQAQRVGIPVVSAQPRETLLSRLKQALGLE
jgi:hypothetical protein